MKDVVVFCFPVQTLYVGKFLQVSGQNALLQSDCRIIWSSISLEAMHWYLWYFIRRYSPKNVACKGTTFAWVCLGMSSHAQICLDIPGFPLGSFRGIST